MEYKRILVASDLSPASDSVVSAAVAMAKGLGADLSVLYVLTEERLRDMREDLPVEGAYVDTLTTRLRSELEIQVERLGGTAVDTSVERGEPGEVVHRHASDAGADVIVIGVRNRSRVGKLLLGSTTQEILLDSPCPVLGVPV